MELVIKIKMDNAAFAEGPNGTEAARILREAADKIENYELCKGPFCNLRDINGNKVGSIETK